MRTIRGVAATVTLVAAATGCSVYEDFTTSDFAQQDGDAIVVAASEAMLDVTSMRVTGQVRDGGEQFFVDLSMDRDDRCTGTLRVGGSHLDIRRIGDRAWLKGEAGAFNRLGGGAVPRQVLDRLSSSWLQLDGPTATRLCDFDALLATFEVVDLGQEEGRGDGRGKGGSKGDSSGGRADDPVPASVVEETTIDGHKAVQLTASPGGAHAENTWVLSEAPHHVVKLESTSMQDGGTLSFSEFDVAVEVEAPPRQDVIRP
jgi:hypothetical protein